MSFIIFETAQKIYILKSTDIDALTRAIEAAAVCRNISIHAEMPFASTDEAAMFSQLMFEAQYTEEVVAFLKQQIPAGSTVIVQDARLQKQMDELKYKTEQNIAVFRQIRHFFETLFKQKPEDAYQASRALSHATSRLICQFDKNKSDQQVIQGIGYYETLLKDINSQAMRLIECVGFHFPEFKRLVVDLDVYIMLTYLLKNRVYMKEHPLEELLPKVLEVQKEQDIECSTNIKQLLIQLYKAALISTGCEFQEPEYLQLQLLETKCYNLLIEKQQTIKFLERKLQIVAPNVLTVLGTLNTARLIAKAGTLSKLAKAPASTVQLYGAEKALFRVLKRKSNRTPKYGLLFRSNHVQACKHVKARGRVARALACCVARCARVDFYSEAQNTEYGKAMKQLMDQRVAFYDGTLKGEMVRMADVVKQFEE
ncbi:Nop_domain-containing protein [Hexamita inflata]|uniref:Nop domain-containing protein n=1 Tax=Hexamita inflata TaxID=28002 RepID=A0AA86NMQ5_9EUKA|nr:Nop domain-containing protein [Hexamita inflata]CAI9978230.1 Nop domain-containing protein [Hexamita inflata]